MIMIMMMMRRRIITAKYLRFIQRSNSSVDILIPNTPHPNRFSWYQGVFRTSKSRQNHFMTLFVAEVGVEVLFQCVDDILNRHI